MRENEQNFITSTKSHEKFIPTKRQLQQLKLLYKKAIHKVQKYIVIIWGS